MYKHDNFLLVLMRRIWTVNPINVLFDVRLEILGHLGLDFALRMTSPSRTGCIILQFCLLVATN